MKIQHLIPILFLAAFCTVSAQTNTPTTPALLTTNQAETLAIRLANEKWNETHKVTFTNNIIVFRTNTTVTMNETNTGTTIDTHFVDGHWNLHLEHGDQYVASIATVELAPDGSTNAVKLWVKNYTGFMP